jgi:hypothetical protein
MGDIGQDESQSLFWISWIKRYISSPGFEDPQQYNNQIGGALNQNWHQRLWTDTLCLQPMSYLICLAIQLSIC